LGNSLEEVKNPLRIRRVSNEMNLRSVSLKLIMVNLMKKSLVSDCFKYGHTLLTVIENETEYKKIFTVNSSHWNSYGK